MKKHILFITGMYCLSITARAQFCNTGSGGCYQKDSCFQTSQIHTQDYKYATVHNIYKASGVSVNLYMTIYSPCALPQQFDSRNNPLKCLQCKRPFMLLIHGGGFRTGCKTELDDECIEFAKRGYVAATIDYRLGWVPGDEKQASANNFCFSTEYSPIQGDSCNPEYKDSLNFEVYRALQDASAAMRFIVHNAANLNIDTNYLYIGGHSAGSVIATNLCYLNQKELNQVAPKANSILGPLYSGGNSFTDTYKICGLFNNWGSLPDTIYIKGALDKIPMIAFHGIDDLAVPFAKGFSAGCKNGAYGYSYGSSAIFDKLINSYPNLPVELYCCYGGHGILDNDPSEDLKSLYRIQKAICFFNRVRNGDETQICVRINKLEDLISYNELNSKSPVNCSYTNLKNNAVSYNNTVNSNNITHISDLKPPAEFIIYPNPATSAATLVVKGGSGAINVMITDLDGRVLWKKENATENTINLPVKDLANGLYLVVIKNDEYTGVLKLIKSN